MEMSLNHSLLLTLRFCSLHLELLAPANHFGSGRKYKGNKLEAVFTLSGQVVKGLACKQLCCTYTVLWSPVGFSFNLERECEGFVFHRGFSLQLSANTC